MESEAERRLRGLAESIHPPDAVEADACDIGREAIALLREADALVGSGDADAILAWDEKMRALLSRARQAQEGR